MTSMPPSTATTPLTAAHFMPPESWPNYDHIVTEDGKPVDGFYDEKQMRLLTSVLYDSWPGPGDHRPFLTTANVGLFYSFREPPIVPDVMLSLDVRIGDPQQKKHRSYFVWEHGKAPEAAIEIVSGTDGEELGNKRRIYAKIGVAYYVVWDPRLILGKEPLLCFILHGRKYKKNGPWFPDIGLGVTAWQGEFEGWNKQWLRWCDKAGNVLPMGVENVAQEKQRAEQEKQRAEKLAEKLRSLGVDPNQP